MPGKQLCKRCLTRINDELAAARVVEANEAGGADEPDYVPGESSQSESEIPSETELNRSELNTSLGEIGVSPLKLHSLSSGSKVKEGKRKLQRIEDKQLETTETVRKKIAKVLDVQESKLTSFNKAAEYDRIVGLVSEKLQTTSDNRMRVQLLTLAPRSESVTFVAQQFNASKYLVQKSRAVFGEKGILGMPDQYHGHGLSDDVKNIVKLFYQQDEYSRTMPGKKDFVSIKRNVHMQKRLLLCNVNELFAQFKEEHPNIKICRSSFASLRPKWCVTVDTTGSHSVCVCIYHQNVKLMIDACKFKTDQHTLTDLIVCDRNNRDCMIHRCDSCPGVEPLREHLLAEFQKLAEEKKQASSSDGE